MSDSASNPAGLIDHVMGIATGYVNSQVLFNADELDIFTLLSDGPKQLEALAKKVALDPDPLERLLIGCCTLGLVKRGGDRFELTDASRAHLVRDTPGYVGGMFPMFKNVAYPVAQHLDAAMRERKPQYEKIPDIDPKGPFEALYKNDDALREFQRAMFALSYPTGLAASELIDFSRFENIVDVGGGTGGFLNALCRRSEKLGGAIFDLPVVETAALDTAAENGHAERIRFLPGDFFEDPLPAADLYVLGDILHDWNETEGTRLLEKVYESLPENGAVCIHEGILRDTRDGAHMTAYVNLLMLLFTDGGKQRSPSEFTHWLGDIGFNRFEHHFLAAPRDVFVAWKGQTP